MIFLLSLFITLAFTAVINSLFGFTGRVSAWLRLFLLFWANLILSAQISGGLSLLTPLFYLIIQFILLLTALLVYRTRAMPDLIFPYTGGKRWLPARKITLSAAVLGAAAALVYAFNLILSFFVPQNNYDSLTYHLARVGYWIQHHSLAFWETPDFRQTTFPPNAELGILWSMLLSGSERLSGLVQWSAALACMIAIYGIARLLKASSSQAVFAALLWASLPQVLLQSTTTQNDLVIAAFIACGVFFLHSGLQADSTLDLAFSGAAFGLALGTKTTIFFALPGVGIAAVLWMLPRLKKTGGRFAAWIAFCLAGFILLGSMVYGQNWLAYRSPLGPGAEGEVTTAVSSRFARLGQNTLIYAYQFLDFSGLPAPIAEKLVEFKARAAAKILRKLNWSGSAGVWSIQQILNLPPRTHEDVSWFGPVLWLGFLPAWGFSFRKALKDRRMDLLAYGLMGGLFLVLVSFLIGWTPFKSRYFIPCTALAAPLFFLLDRPRFRLYPAGLALLAVVMMINTTFFNEARPLVGPRAIWGKDALTLRTMNMPQMQPVVAAVETHVPVDGRLALHLGENGADYLFFGAGLQRELVQVDPIIQRAGISGLKSVQADYLLIGPRQQFFFTPPPGLELVEQVNNATLYRIDNALLGTANGIQSGPFPESDSQRLVFVAPELNREVAVMEVWTGAWTIEQVDGNGFYWLGQGEPQGLGMTIWSEGELSGLLHIKIEPGPSRADPARTLAAVPSINHKRQPVQYYPFSTPADLLVPIHLIQGVNEIGFYILEAADGSALPNGDTRTLLARIHRITIEPQP